MVCLDWRRIHFFWIAQMHWNGHTSGMYILNIHTRISISQGQWKVEWYIRASSHILSFTSPLWLKHFSHMSAYRDALAGGASSSPRSASASLSYHCLRRGWIGWGVAIEQCHGWGGENMVEGYVPARWLCNAEDMGVWGWTAETCEDTPRGPPLRCGVTGAWGPVLCGRPPGIRLRDAELGSLALAGKGDSSKRSSRLRVLS